jgi:hypothetical protein
VVFRSALPDGSMLQKSTPLPRTGRTDSPISGNSV